MLRAQQREYPGEDKDPFGSDPQGAESFVQTFVGHGGSAIRAAKYVGQHRGHEQHLWTRSSSEKRECRRNGARSSFGFDDQQVNQIIFFSEEFTFQVVRG